MSDIVDWLKDCVFDYDELDDERLGLVAESEVTRRCKEAAAEIERLRIERDEARKTMREWSENCGAEVQKLRSALHSIEQSTFYSEEANQIARKALGLHQEWPIAQGD